MSTEQLTKTPAAIHDDYGIILNPFYPSPPPFYMRRLLSIVKKKREREREKIVFIFYFIPLLFSLSIFFSFVSLVWLQVLCSIYFPALKTLAINTLLSTIKCTFNFEGDFGMDQWGDANFRHKNLPVKSVFSLDGKKKKKKKKIRTLPICALTMSFWFHQSVTLIYYFARRSATIKNEFEGLYIFRHDVQQWTII